MPQATTAPSSASANVLVYPVAVELDEAAAPAPAPAQSPLVTPTPIDRPRRGSQPARPSTAAPAAFPISPDGILLPDPGAPFDLLAAMRADRRLDSAARTESVRMFNFPAYLSLNLRRVLARDRTQRGNTAQALGCLIWHGIARYLALPAVKGFTEALSGLELDDDVPARVAEQIEGWKRGLRFSIVDPTHSMGVEKSRSFRVAESVHSELFDLAGKLGLPGGVLATMCVMVGLADQPGVLREHGQYMAAAVDELDGQLVDRERRLRGLLVLVESGVWP